VSIRSPCTLFLPEGLELATGTFTTWLLVDKGIGPKIQLMRGWLHVRFFPLALLQICLCPIQLCAQLPPRLERCLPYPTLAQELRTMNEEPKPPAPAQPPAPKVAIVSIAFAPGTHIPPSVRDRIFWSIKSPQLYDDPDQTWLQELQDVGVLGALQDSGYYRATVKVDARMVEATQRRNRYALTLHIEEGWRYRLCEVRFEPSGGNTTLAYSSRELREHIHMRRGEFFNVSEVRGGLAEIERLYGTRGYIDMVPTPEVHNDDNGGPLELVIKVDEGKQYRVGKIEFLGLDAKAQSQLRPQLKSGEVFDRSLAEEFLRGNQTLLPVDASLDDVQIKRNAKEGVVDMRFDFYTCHTAEKRTPSH